MPPRNDDISAYDVHEDLSKTLTSDPDYVPLESKPVPMVIRWRNVALFAMLHIGGLIGIYVIPSARLYTLIFTFALYILNNLGITAGAHRLWTHRSYHAKLPLRIFLALCNSLALQNDIIEWCRDHRVHHKYSETNADPHNATRGFFFAHIGWLLVRKHPDVRAKGQKLDISDLLADPVCAFQRKFYLQSVALMCFATPTLVPWYFWGESLFNSFYICALFRYLFCLHTTWLVNSAAHLYGNKPYDQHINPSENFLVSMGALGEGFHNYHHTFPHDYSTSEFGLRFNFTTFFIDTMAFIGLADKRRKMSPEAIERRKDRTGDGSVGFGFRSVQHIPKKSNPNVQLIGEDTTD